MSFSSRTLKALEYGKVLEHLAGCCISPSGREAALALRPYADPQEAQMQALLFDQCRTWAAESGTATHKGDDEGFKLISFPDVTGVGRFLQSQAAVLDLDALWALREVLRLSQRAVTSIRKGEAARWPLLLELAESVPLPEDLTRALQRCLADDGQLRDESSPELLLARTELRRLHQSCMRKVKDFAIQYNILHYLQDEFMTLASDRYVLPLKANFKGRLQGIIHDWSQTGETCYFEPMFLVEINNRLQELKHQEREEERKVMAYLTGLTRASLPAVDAAAQFLVRLDVLLATGKLADHLGGAVCVTLTDEGGVNLLQARHPLLALGKSAQPIDVTLRPHERGLIISGGNAGGKTVCLKTLGLLALMALTGLPLPVGRGSSLPCWRRIHAFIGDEQSLDDSVSTFTAQIHHLAEAWAEADGHSLILLDEFGAGTDPAQGAALAQAVLDGLLDRDICVVAATHFPALKAYALTREKARAASVLFDPGTKRPLFKLAYDQVGASQALDVAREHGLPDSILRRAEQYLLLDGEDASSVMSRLNELAVTREKEIAHLKAEQERQREKRQKLQERFERERQKLHDEVRAQAGELMRAWKAGKLTHKQALKDMSRLRAQLATPAKAAEVEEKPALAAEILRQGQSVTHRPFGKKAVVLEVDTRRQRARVDMGGVTLWAEMKDLQIAEGGHTAASAPGNASRPSGHISAPKSSPGPLLCLDLRGKRADLALSELSQFLDQCLLSGRESVEIVHGRGTGVLRKEVHNFLRTFPGIDSFDLAPEDRGGDGMTVVNFR